MPNNNWRESYVNNAKQEKILKSRYSDYPW